MFAFRSNRFRAFVAGIGGLLLGVLITAFIQAGDLYDYQDTYDGVQLPDVDAVVCLVGGRGRVLTAADLWIRYFEENPKKEPPFLYFSGVAPQTTWTVLSNQMRSGIKNTIRPAQVIMENVSTNTLTNAEVLVEQVKSRGWKRIMLVTSSYHMKRSLFILNRVLKRQGVALQIETATHFQEPFDRSEWRWSLLGIQVTLSEFVKSVYYRWTMT